MFQPVREAFGAFRCLGLPARGYLSGYPAELTLDGDLDAVRGASDQRIQSFDRDVQPVRGRKWGTAGTVFVE